MPTTPRLPVVAILALAGLAPLAWAQVVRPIDPPTGITVAGVGFAGPESMLHDDFGDVYLVSNINGSPLEADGNGFISRLSPEGEILELRWIDGEREGVELDAPKGMAISGDTLYVADIDNVRMFDRQTGEPTGTVEIPEASFLNGVAAADEGGVFVTDTSVGPDFQPTGNAAVYHVSAEGMMTQVIANPELGAPNGVAAPGLATLLVVTLSQPGQVIRIVGGEIESVMELTAGQLDGIVLLDNGDLLVSSWSAAAVLRVEPDGSATPVVEGVESPADIGFDATRQLILIPLLQHDEVRIAELPQPESP